MPCSFFAQSRIDGSCGGFTIAGLFSSITGDGGNAGLFNKLTISTTTSPHLTYTRRKPSLTGLTHRVMTSTHLTGWTEDSTATQTVTGTSGDVETVQVTLSASLLSEAKLFIRITAQ
jgi:hypothetical protein